MNGGYIRLAELSGLQSHRRPRGFWKDINNVLVEIQAFMQQRQKHEQTQKQQQRQKRQEHKQQQQQQSTGGAAATVGAMSQHGGESHREQDLPFRYLPTQQELLKASRWVKHALACLWYKK